MLMKTCHFRDKIENEYKNALKSKNKVEISTYRLILSGIKFRYFKSIGTK